MNWGFKMKHLFLSGAILVLASCSNEGGNIEDELDTGVSVLSIDSSVYAESIVMDNIAVDRLEYGCAKVYLQIPRQYTNASADGIQTIISHELWSVPVQKLPGNEVWTSIDTEFNTVPPSSENGNLIEGEDVYALIMTQDGDILYDQSVRAVVASKKWYVCENYYCEPGGCQSHDEFEDNDWTCNPSQERLLSEQEFSKCPCTFNISGYPYCGFEDEKK